MGETKHEPAFMPGTLDMLVLKTVSRGPMHGYSIAQHIQQASNDVLRVEEGRSLHRYGPYTFGEMHIVEIGAAAR